jgi:hypothetical protein
MHKRYLSTAMGLVALCASGLALADVTCIVPTLSRAQLAETGDQALNEANCSTGDAGVYASLMHMTGWTNLTGPQCVAPNWPQQRFLNAIRLVDKAEAAMVFSVSLDRGWTLVQQTKSTAPGCKPSGDDPWAITSSTGKVTFFWKFFYNSTMIDRAATLVHEAAHSALGKTHVTSGDVTIIGENSCHFSRITSCDTRWSYAGAWQREVLWLEAYAAQGNFVVNPSLRRLATDVGNADLNDAFVERPLNLQGDPRIITCTPPGCL